MLMFMVHIPLEYMGMSLVWVAARDCMNVQGMCIIGPAPHWVQNSESWPYLSLQAVLGRARPKPCQAAQCSWP